MASYQQLTDDLYAWLKRRDITQRIPGWVAMAETDIGAMLRARCNVARATQAIDANFITLPVDFAEFESVRDVATGELLDLEDNYTGPMQCEPGSLGSTAYRLVGDCIEFLPHPIIPPPTGSPLQQVSVVFYAKPRALKLPGDTNKILESLYAVYLFGTCKYGAMYELDDERAAQMDKAFIAAVTAANMAKETGDYSGAPLRAAPAMAF